MVWACSKGMEGKYIRVKVDDHGEAQFYLPESLRTATTHTSKQLVSAALS
jgi:hypothetical protein